VQTKYLTALIALVAGLLILAIYWPGLHGAFFFDDGPSILQAEGVRLGALSMESLRQALVSGGAGPSGRPVAQLSFAFNYYLSGFNPFAFKVTNLAIHLACGWLVFALAGQLLRAAHPRAKPQSISIAAAAVALLWLFHPIQLLPVFHVVQRMTSLSTLFLLSALLLHMRAREEPGRASIVRFTLAWGILWPLSFLSKETGALFPLFALAWELTVHRCAKGSLDRPARFFAVLVGVALVAGVVYALSPRGHWLWAGYAQRPFSLLERVLTEGRVLWYYIGLIVWPRLSAFGLHHDDIALSTGIHAPWTTLPAAMAAAGLVWLVWRFRNRAPLAALGVAWFLIGHALESTVLPLEIAHEHRNYLPLFGITLLVGWALLQAQQWRKGGQSLMLAVTAGALAGVIVLTALRAYPFGDEVQRTLIEVANHPLSPRAQNEAAGAVANLPHAAVARSEIYKLARHHHEQALALDPGFKMSGLGLIHLNCKAGLPPERAEIEELMRRLRETPFAPGDQTVLYAVKEMALSGPPCLSRSDVKGLFAAALANPRVSDGVRAMMLSWQADYLWLHERDLDGARSALAQSLALSPGNLSNRLKWAQLLLLSGEQDQARQLLLALRAENFSAEERQTITELLEALKIK
jgi:hypothetical protein